MKVRNSKEQQRQRLRRTWSGSSPGAATSRKCPAAPAATIPASPGAACFPFAQSPRATRTDLSQVAAAIDARKKRGKRRSAKRTGPRRRLVYDDFGEPLRWVWED